MFRDPEFDNRYRGKFYGKYRGEVVEKDDPKKLGRLRVHVPTIHGTDFLTGERPVSGWAFPAFGSGGENSGVFFIPPVGSTVWVEFEEGFVERPIWQHGAWTLLGGEEDTPRHARGNYDESDNFERGTDLIPPPQLAADYGSANIVQSPSGHKLELDDTPNRKRVVLEHSTGARLEILDDGTIMQIAAGNQRNVVRGSDRKHVAGPATTEISGSVEETYKKVRTVTDREFERIVLGNASYVYAHNRDTNVVNDTTTVQGSQIITVFAEEDKKVLGGSKIGVNKSYTKVIGETAKWLILNAGLTPALPGQAAADIHLASGTGDLVVQRGLDPTGITNQQLVFGGIPGAADVLLKAVSIMSLTAPIVQIGNPVTPMLPLVQSSILTLLDTHVHTGGTIGGLTGPPSPVEPFTAAAATFLTASTTAN